MLINEHKTTSECVKFTISKGLNMGIIAGSLLYKVPQITKILGAKSVEGIALSSFYTQLVMVMVSISYNLYLKSPIDTYAENLSVLVQTVILIILHWVFNPKTSKACVVASLGAFAGISYVLFGGILPARYYDYIGFTNVVLTIMATLPQIITNFKNKSTGQLAFLTVFLAFAGNAARIFTTVQTVNDPLLIAMFSVGVFLQGVIILQILILGGAKPKGKVKGE